jgi:hypothetical protein
MRHLAKLSVNDQIQLVWHMNITSSTKIVLHSMSKLAACKVIQHFLVHVTSNQEFSDLRLKLVSVKELIRKPSLKLK